MSALCAQVSRHHICSSTKPTPYPRAARSSRRSVVCLAFNFFINRKASSEQSPCAVGAPNAATDSKALVLSDRDSRYYREIKFERSLLSFNVPAPEDYYALLSLDEGMSPTQDEIKAAYRKLQRMVHPDVVGTEANALAVILNACYTTLMDEGLRAAYDYELAQYKKHGGGTFDGRPVSGWMGPNGETRAVFVAENECIGCRQCTLSAPSTFFIEEEHGRARVANQWADDEDMVKEAVQSCPVDCIYYVQRAQLPLLEFVMKSCKRENPGLMGRRRSGNMGPAPASECPFEKAVVYVKARKNVKVEEAAGMRAGKPLHDEVTAAAIARAWLELPLEVRAKGWPEWAA